MRYALSATTGIRAMMYAVRVPSCPSELGELALPGIPEHSRLTFLNHCDQMPSRLRVPGKEFLEGLKSFRPFGAGPPSKKPCFVRTRMGSNLSWRG